MFSGPDLERWSIKLLVGLLVSGNATLDGQKIVREIPSGWLEVIMGRKHLPSGTGLGSMMVAGGSPRALPQSVAFSPVFYSEKDGTESPVGGELWINDLAFGLVLANIPNKTGTWAANFASHTNMIRYSGPSSSVTIFLAGDGWDQANGVELTWRDNPPT